MKKQTLNKLFSAAAAIIVLTGCSSVDNTFENKDTAMSDQIKIGWAKRSIAPKEGVAPITGQFYLRVAMGQYTPVLTSALVMENKSDAVIFVSADMVSVPDDVLLLVQKNLAAEVPEIPAAKIIINATHTHAGPSAKAPENRAAGSSTDSDSNCDPAS